MNPIVERFLERPTSHKIGIWFLALAFGIFIYWQYFFSGKSSELLGLREKIDTLDAQVTHEQRVARNLKKYREETKTMEAKLELALKQLPDSREIPDLLSAVAALAKDSGLDVKRFAPRVDVPKDFYAEVPVDIELRGTFHQLATFFDEIAGLARVVNVSGISLQDPRGVEEQAHVKLDNKVIVTTFRYLPEQERAKMDEAKKGKEDRKKRVKKSPKDKPSVEG